MATYTLNVETGHYKLTGHPVALRVLRNFALEPSGPFYHYVLTYLCASAGFTPVYDARNQDFMEGVHGYFPGKVADDAHADLGECVRLARDGATLPQLRAEQALCCMLANAAYESVDNVDRDRLNSNPVFEFFRHVRNAASHGNKWHFFAHEPARPAKWTSPNGRGVEIDSTKGDKNSLHGQTCVYGTIEPADLLYLLRDVEGLLT